MFIAIPLVLFGTIFFIIFVEKGKKVAFKKKILQN